eukprot:scaffold415914_cov22-Prasinocladus_malaysianus.AAC.1
MPSGKLFEHSDVAGHRLVVRNWFSKSPFQTETSVLAARGRGYEWRSEITCEAVKEADIYGGG